MNPNCGPKPFDLDAACDKSVDDTESCFLNNFKTASPLPNRLHRRTVSIKKGMTRARVSRRQPLKASGRLIGLAKLVGASESGQ